MLRRKLMLLATIVTIFGALHEADHLLRGDRLSAIPFAASFIIFPILIGGVVYANRGKLMAGYWLFVATLGFLLAAPTHLGTHPFEPLSVVYGYYSSPIAGTAAIVVVLGLLASLIVLGSASVYARVRAGHW